MKRKTLKVKWAVDPEVTFSAANVNGVSTLIPSTQRVVQNLMSGRDVVQDKDTPLCCDVSSETYWSM